MDLAEQIQRSLLDHALLEKGDSVLIGVSGGVDSMVLLHLLHRIGHWKLHVAHFNHCLRAVESDSDESFVQGTAESLFLPYVSNRADVKKHADHHGVSIEMAARELRHGFLIESAVNLGINRIALAHHADDQVETFWLRLLRGDVGPGLTGMRWSRPARAGTDIRFIRPLLEIPKADLVRFAKENNVSFRDDSSNTSPDFLRNRLRLELIARLKNFQPSLRDVTLRTANVLAAEKDFLEKSARSWLQKREAPFGELHPALQREVIRLQMLELALKPNFDLIETLRTAPSLPVSLSRDLTIARNPGGDLTLSPRSAVTFSEGSLAIALDAPGRLFFEEFDIQWDFVPSRTQAESGVEFFDANLLGKTVTVRHWRRGDRFHPIGMSSDVKLQNLFTNSKVPASEKRQRLLATDSSGNIFWVEGLRISELHKVTAQSTHLLRWSVKRRL
jgi:tRNA(Ile)-lysidine synthase